MEIGNPVHVPTPDPGYRTPEHSTLEAAVEVLAAVRRAGEAAPEELWPAFTYLASRGHDPKWISSSDRPKGVQFPDTCPK